MIQLIKKYEEVILYLVMGFLAMIVNLVLKYILLFIVFDASNGLELQTAIIISWFFTILFAYFTNCIFVFKSKNCNIFKEIINFYIARVITLLMEMFIMWFFVTLLKLDTNFWVIIWTLFSQVIVIISNYIFSKFLIFKKES